MKIIIPGGSGQIGTVLSRAFHQNGHEVVVLSRNSYDSPWKVVEWDGQNLGEWTGEFEGADVVINLAGRSVNCRYTPENRQIIKESRVNSTKAVGEAILQGVNPPPIWLQASTATIYAHRYDAPNDEFTGILSGSEPDLPDTWNFSNDVAQSWEKAMDEFELPHTRKVKLRTSLMFSPDPGGVFDVMLGLVRKGLGGKNGDGRQYVSWIHHEDYVHAISWIIDHPELEGAVNVTAPNPLPNRDFMKYFREAWGIKVGLPATKWMLEIGTFFMRTETELILKSRRVVPGHLLESGFTFKYPNWKEAVEDLCARWRKAHY